MHCCSRLSAGVSVSLPFWMPFAPFLRHHLKYRKETKKKICSSTSCSDVVSHRHKYTHAHEQGQHKANNNKEKTKSERKRDWETHAKDLILVEIQDVREGASACPPCHHIVALRTGGRGGECLACVFPPPRKRTDSHAKANGVCAQGREVACLPRLTEAGTLHPPRGCHLEAALAVVQCPTHAHAYLLIVILVVPEVLRMCIGVFISFSSSRRKWYRETRRQCTHIQQHKTETSRCGGETKFAKHTREIHFNHNNKKRSAAHNVIVHPQLDATHMRNVRVCVSICASPRDKTKRASHHTKQHVTRTRWTRGGKESTNGL